MVSRGHFYVMYGSASGIPSWNKDRKECRETEKLEKLSCPQVRIRSDLVSLVQYQRIVPISSAEPVQTQYGPHSEDTFGK